LIDGIEDEHILYILKEDIIPSVIQNRTKESGEEDDLTKEQLKELNQSLKTGDRGDAISFEEFKKLAKKWRTK